MAKLSRDVLKSLVKECLVEILAEGLSGQGAQLNEITKNKKPTARRDLPKRAAPDLISVGKQRKQQPQNAAIERRIKAAAGGNNIMESILRDTAQNTLPNMVAAEGKKDGIASRSMAQRVSQGDAATKAMAAVDPMDIFEGASNWAALAFADDTRKQ